MKPFSVVIPTRNNCSMKNGSLLAVLECLERSADAIEDVAVVDNASTDQRLCIQPGAWRNRVVFTSFDAQPHIGAARNLGVRYTRGPFVVFIDDDMMLPGDSLLRLATQVHEDAFWTCAQRRYLPWGTQVEHVRSAAKRGDLDWFTSHSTPVPGCDRIEQRFQALYRPTFIGSFGIVPRAMFEQVGGFDEAFTGWGGEDTDLLVRLLAVAPLVPMFKQHVGYHYDHVISPYRLLDRDNASRRLGEKLHRQGQDFDIVLFSEAVIRGDDVSRWNVSLEHQRRLAATR